MIQQIKVVEESIRRIIGSNIYAIIEVSQRSIQ